MMIGTRYIYIQREELNVNIFFNFGHGLALSI